MSLVEPSADPPFYGDLDVDAANLTAYATAVEERTGVHVTATHLVGKAVAHARVRAGASGDVLFAVAGPGTDEPTGTLVEQAHQKPVAEIARELDGERPPAEAGPGRAVGCPVVTTVGGSGFTRAYAPLTGYDGAPVLVLVGAVTPRPVAIEGRVVIRPVLTLTATFDHRHVGGQPAAAFARGVHEFCAHPERFDEHAAPTVERERGRTSDARISG